MNAQLSCLQLMPQLQCCLPSGAQSLCASYCNYFLLQDVFLRIHSCLTVRAVHTKSQKSVDSLPKLALRVELFINISE